MTKAPEFAIMIVLYDWIKIDKLSEGRMSQISIILDMIVNKTRTKYSDQDFHGYSFMKNPRTFLAVRKRYHPQELYQYLSLASLRNYADYVIYGKNWLDTRLVQTETIQQNRLLKVENNKIYFILEGKFKEWH